MTTEKKPLNNKEKAIKGILWSFKRILIVGIVIAAIGGWIFMDAAIKAGKTKSRHEQEILGGQEQFAGIVIATGVIIMGAAVFYRTTKINKIEHYDKLEKIAAKSSANHTDKDKNLAKIEDLKKLLDNGAITQEEYEQKKKELLEKL